MSESTQCSFGSCERRAYAKQLCSTHYEQQRAGKPLTPIGTYERQPAQCTAGNCGRKPYASGLCTGHYAQRRRGEQFTPIGTRRRGRPSSRDETLCVVQNCSGIKEGTLFCAIHRAQLGSEIGDEQDGSCRVLGCNTSLHSHGFCKIHWGRITRYGRVDRVYTENQANSCSVDGCTQSVHAKGYCRTHYRRVQRTGDSGSAELIPQSERKISKYEGKTCSVEGCGRQPTSKGWCRMHYHRWRRDGNPEGKWGAEPRKSKGYTTTDGYFMANDDGRKILGHRLVMEKIIGRPLYRFEEPHHKNGIRDDNSPENLELWVKWRQPNGQRLSDLINFVVTNYPAEVLAALAERTTSVLT